MSCAVYKNGSVTEPSPPSRHAPNRPRAAIKDLTLLVRVAGRPEDVRAFTDAERDEAAAYAAETGGITEYLPVLGTRPGPVVVKSPASV
jgi:hypothetical protein